MATNPKRSVGGREWLALPDFGIACIQATLDPGGEESTLLASGGVVSDEDVSDEDGETRARFSIRPIAGDDRTIVVAEASLVSGSETSLAVEPVIHTLVTLGTETWPVDLRLVSDQPRQARLHLGRDALGERFTVLPQESFLAGPPAPG